MRSKDISNTLTPEKCRLCFSDRHLQSVRAEHVYGDNKGRKFWQCGQCDAIYLFPPLNEQALAAALAIDRIGGAAIDVFEDEPYRGPLATFDNRILTAHMGSMSEDCRSRMEIEAVDEALRFVKSEPLLNPVPEFEYDVQNSMGYES